MPPLASLDEVHAGSAGVRDAIQVVSQYQGMGPEHMKRKSSSMAEEQMKPPKSEQTPSLETLGPSSLSGTVQSLLKSQFPATDVDTTIPRSQDYFASKRPATSEVADFAAPLPVPSSANYSPSPRGTPTKDSSTPASPDSHALLWNEFFTQHQASPPYNSYKNARPTSVPNFQTKPAPRRREGPEYPNYPDQSFKALQSQHYPQPYRPSSPHPLRTRSSHLSQSSSLSSSDNQSPSDLPHLPSGAKTVGNTPAQSPGLFSPMFPVKRQWPSESDDGRSGTPTLHPTHHKPPKECVQFPPLRLQLVVNNASTDLP